MAADGTRKGTGGPGLSGRSRWLPLLLLAVLTIGAHAWEHSGEFVYDDFTYIVSNTAVQGGIGDWRAFFTNLRASGNPDTGHFRPLVGLSYAADVSLGWGTFGFKVTQLMLHLLAVLGLYWLVGLLGRSRPGVPSVTPFLAAAWVAIVPFNVDAVHYLTARSSVLCGLFSVLAVGCYVRMRQVRDGAAEWYGAHLACVVLAVLSKETGLALPAVVLAADLLLLRPNAAPDARRGPTYWWPYLPYLAGGLAAWLLMPNVHRVFDYVTRVFDTEWRVAAAIRCLAENLRLMLLPTGLSITHPIGMGMRLADAGTLASAVFVALVLAGAWRARRRAPLVTFGVAWYFLLISPSTFVVLQEVLQEHRGYPASMGVGIVVGWGAGWLWAEGRRRRRLVAAGLACMAALLLVTTYVRQQVWANELALWTQALKIYPDSSRAWGRLGVYYRNHGQPERAEWAMSRALALAPDWLDAVQGLAGLYQADGKFALAEQVLHKAQERLPNEPALFGQLAQLYEATGQLDKLVPLYGEALERWPEHAAEARLALAGVHRRMGDLDDAERQARTALALRPDWAAAVAELGTIARERGDTAGAVQWFRQAADLEPKGLVYRIELGDALREAGRPAEAVDVLTAVTANAPSIPLGQFRLAQALEAAGRGAEAVPHYLRFLALAPANDADGRRAQARERLAALRDRAAPAP